MKSYSEFHDGFLDGFLMDGDSAYIFLRTQHEAPFVLEVLGVGSLKVDGFRQGNIIYDVLLRSSDEISRGDVTSLFGFNDEEQALLQLEKVRQQRLCVIEVNPSYGASALIMARSVNLIQRQEWRASHLL